LHSLSKSEVEHSRTFSFDPFAQHRTVSLFVLSDILEGVLTDHVFGWSCDNSSMTHQLVVPSNSCSLVDGDGAFS